MRLKYESKRDMQESSKDFANRIFSGIKDLSPNAKKILDVGMGQGNLVKKLRNSGLNAFGIDLRELGQDNLIVADAKNLPFKSEVFDVVVECYLIADVQDFQKHTDYDVHKIIDETKRVLKKGGLFITVPSISYSEKVFREKIGDNGWGFYRK